MISRRVILRFAKRSLLVAAPSLILPSRMLAQIGPPPVLVPMAPIPWANLRATYLNGGTQINGSGFTAAFGAAAAGRYLICCGSVTSGTTFSGITIAGVAATIVASIANSNNQLLMGVALVPTGTSGLVSFTWAGTGNATYGLYSMIGAVNPLAPLVSTVAGGSFSHLFSTIRGSFAIAYYYNINIGGSHPSWSAGVVEDAYISGGNTVLADQSMASGAADNGGNFTVTGASGGISPAAIAAVWHS